VIFFAFLLVALLPIVFIAFTAQDRSVLLGRAASIDVGGATRTYRVVEPDGSSQSRRLVIALHGYTGNGRQFAYYTALHNAFGPETLIAYPDSTRTTPKGDKSGWNAQFCCGSGWKSGVDDVAFLRTLIEELRAKYKIDKDRVFLVGFSNGAFMTQRFAVEHPELIAGVAVLSGTIGTTASSLKPTTPVPMLLTHGAKDTRVMYAGGESPGDPDFDWLSFDTTTATWKQTNGCTDESAIVAATERVKTTTYQDCKAPLITVEYLENGHVWDGRRLGNFWTKRPRASVEIARFFDSLS
jgi:polyhydroxybutyrate depolymerase